MPTIRVAPGAVGKAIRQDAVGLKGAFRKGTLAAAHKARTRLVRDSPVDRGLLKNAWVVQRNAADTIPVQVENSAPYAGVIERGARPGGLYGQKAIEAIAGWVKRKLLKAGPKRGRVKAGPMTPMQNAKAVDADAEAMRIARAIVERYRKHGRAGKFFVKKLLPHFSQDAHKEVLHAVQQYFLKRRGVNV